MTIEEDLSVFDDGPTVGLGRDGNYHTDPYCGAAAPMGSYEAQRGELCSACEGRRAIPRISREMAYLADASKDAAAMVDALARATRRFARAWRNAGMTRRRKAAAIHSLRRRAGR